MKKITIEIKNECLYEVLEREKDLLGLDWSYFLTKWMRNLLLVDHKIPYAYSDPEIDLRFLKKGDIVFVTNPTKDQFSEIAEVVRAPLPHNQLKHYYSSHFIVRLKSNGVEFATTILNLEKVKANE